MATTGAVQVLLSCQLLLIAQAALASDHWNLGIQYSVGYSASLTRPGQRPLEQPKNQYFHNYPFFSFLLVKPWLATAGIDNVSCVYSGITPQLPWLVTAVLIDKTSSPVKPWLVTTGTTRLECAIFHSKHIFYNDNSYKWLQGSPHCQCLPITQE